MKLADSSWGANAETLRTSAMALCYSVAEYCAPVWSLSPHTGLVGVQLNFTMRLIFDTLRSTPLPSLPVLTNIEPFCCHQNAAYLSPIHEAFVAGAGMCRHQKSMERQLEVDSGS